MGHTSKNIFSLQKEALLWNIHMWWWVPSCEEKRLQAMPLCSRWFQFQASLVCILSAHAGLKAVWGMDQHSVWHQELMS